MPPQPRILIVNPNTSTHMTNSLRPIISSLNFNATFTYYTCTSPSGLASINSPDDALKSADACLVEVVALCQHHDGVLIACFSQHPLVEMLRKTTKVVGIWEASVSFAVGISRSVPPRTSEVSFGIVTTGDAWREPLDSATREILATGAESSLFAGVGTTGLSAGELHDAPAIEVERRIKEATKTLIKEDQNMGIVVLGCAGMVGMEGWVKEAGREEGADLKVVDGVKVGVGLLYTWIMSES